MVNTSDVKVPKKYQHMLKEVYKDQDGYWGHCEEGYISSDTECGIIHEYSKSEFRSALRFLQSEEGDNS